VGTNAVLPTGGFAHTFSCTSVYDFLKRTGLAYLSAEGDASLRRRRVAWQILRAFPPTPTG